MENWHQLYKIGGIAALVCVSIIPLQILIFSLYPPPESTLEFFSLYQDNWFLGLLSLDLLYILNNTVIIVMYLGLFASLRKTNFAEILIALVLGLVGIAAYYASTVAFEMLTVSDQYFAAETVALKNQWLAVGHSLLEKYTGTAFDVYYVLNAITLLLISKVMFQDKTFSRSTAIWGLVSGFFMIIPSSAGQLGLVFSLLSLIPWIVFSILVARRLFTLYRQAMNPIAE